MSKCCVVALTILFTFRLGHSFFPYFFFLSFFFFDQTPVFAVTVLLTFSVDQLGKKRNILFVYCWMLLDIWNLNKSPVCIKAALLSMARTTINFCFNGIFWSKLDQKITNLIAGHLPVCNVWQIMTEMCEHGVHIW